MADESETDKTETTKIRITMNSDVDMITRMNWAMDVCGTADRTELYNLLFSIGLWVIQKKYDGLPIAALDMVHDTTYELDMAALEKAMQTGAEHRKRQAEIE